MTRAVMADPQFGVERILRPFPGFETVYAGQLPTVRPIMVTEKGRPLDAAAGKPGYAANILRALPVPLGSRIVIWLPKIVNPTSNPYIWYFAWRLRSTFDYRQSRGNYHLAKQGVGAPDSTVVPPAPRAVKPAAVHAVIYNQAEPVPIGGYATVVQHIRQEQFSVQSADGDPPLPLLPDGSVGIYQQGVFDPAGGVSTAGSPLFVAHEVQAAGDELFIGVYREGAAWNFATIDARFSELLGDGSPFGPFPDIGVYVSTGTAP